ncbi:MAG: hypothetical protein Q8M76_17315 [Spirochaetaceae bacterium]|nr:hypothetical protein [Spirochaetaceae bacterium]
MIPRPFDLGGLGGESLTAYPVPETAWKAMGDWGGMDVDALISCGFLKGLAWILDFVRRVFVFRDSTTEEKRREIP